MNTQPISVCQLHQSYDYHLLMFCMEKYILDFTAMPFWIEEPESVNTAEEESAEFTCRASGRPAPTVTWSSNGVPWQGQYLLLICTQYSYYEID